MKEESFRRSLALTGLLGALAVALGALGAHALKNKMQAGLITEDQLGGFETGVKYHLFHVLAMLLVLLLRKQSERGSYRAAFYFFLSGILFFSGSLYLLCTRELLGAPWLKALGPVTPVGGVLLIAGWCCLCAPLFNKR